jgi:hypothetical protein
MSFDEFVNCLAVFLLGDRDKQATRVVLYNQSYFFGFGGLDVPDAGFCS